MTAMGTDPHNWRELLQDARAELEAAGVASPDYDARELLAAALGVDSRTLALRFGDVPEPEQVAHFEELIRRRAAREPLQHILGTMYFRYLELESVPGVFVVRPETEMVAQAGIDFLRGEARLAASPADSALIVVDLCSGSGAIALSIATEMPRTQVYGVELSPVALESAQRNNQRYGSPVTFLGGDALAPLPEPLETEIAGRARLVISNPPYVPTYHELSPEVLADPHQALFGGGEDGLEFPLALINRARTLLAPGGALVMEHASEQSEALREAALEAGYVAVTTGRDLTGAQRWLFARAPHENG